MSKGKSFLTILVLIFLMTLFSGIVFAGTGKVTTEDSYTMRGDLSIFGRLYLPEDAQTPLPLVILSHGLGSNHEIMEPYAQSFAENGIAAFVFDFIGGSEVSLSDGSMTQMSVLTEAEDLSCILDRFREDSRFTQDEIFLFGGSQGGFISAYVAGKRPEDVAGLVMLYPAFNLQDISSALISESGEIPETAQIATHTVGSIYLKDIQSFDIYEVLSNYSGAALLFHGTADPLVPLEYSERALEMLEDAELVIVEGAGHGFTGEDRSRTEADSVSFVRRLLSHREKENGNAAAIDKSADWSAASKPLTMIIFRNTVGAISGYAALINRGYPMLPLSAELAPEKRKELMKIYRPGLMLVPKELRGSFMAMKELIEFGDYILLKTNYRDRFLLNPQLGQLITTSGSTGSAKFVRQSKENLRFNAAAFAAAFQVSSAEKTITSLPLQYTYGLSVLHANLLQGATMVVTRSGVMDPEFWDLVEAEDVTSFHGVPYTYEMLHRIGLFDDDFPSLRLLGLAGGKLSRELQEYYGRYAAENGKSFVILYGQSEATAAISWLPPEDALKKPGSVGFVVPGGSISFIDGEGNPVEGVHMQGEIVYHGPNVAMGYAQCGEDLKRGDDWNGVLRTGDIAELDEDGCLFITGRLKRFIKLAGHRVSLDEVDSMIMDELNIFSVSVGTDDHLTVFVTDEGEKDMAEDFILKALSAARANLKVLTVPEFPRNEGGKILYSELQKIADSTEQA